MSLDYGRKRRLNRLNSQEGRNFEFMHLSDSRKKIPDLPEKARALIASLTLSESDYHAIELQLEAAFRAGLSASGPPQCVPMLCSHVTRLPGRACGGGHPPGPGDYLALDLGGTNYRVLLVRMRPAGQPPEITENVYSVPCDLMRGSGEALFDFLAGTIADFLVEHGASNLADNSDSPLRLGFTFSFPCEQHGLASARLLGWTKGYSADGVVGNDVCRLLQEAVDRRGLAAHCIALVNDTVGTLAACALEDPACQIGLIVGTGTNAAYVERVAAVERYAADLPAGEAHVVINTEWGNFGADGCLERFRTDLDRQLDAASINPGRQTFEKLVSGMYLGELVRLGIQQLVSDGVLFDGRMPDALRQPMSFHTKYLSEVERDPPRHYYSTDSLLTVDLGLQLVRPLDMMMVRSLCEAVSTRSAYLVATGISCLLKRIASPNEVTVGIDGSLFKFHPHFPQRMIDKINELHPDARFMLRLSEDGSGKGAAAIAAMA